MYFKSRTDLNIALLPTSIPSMGPAGSIIVDPDFQNKIVRMTDENSMFNGLQAYAGIGGSADVNTWNSDSTMLALQDSGGGGAVFGFDPSTLAVKRLFPSWRPGTLIFSRLDPNVAFVFLGTQYMQVDLSDRTLSVPPLPTQVCDFSHLLPGLATWKVAGGVEAADSMFTAAFSITGSQGTGVYACAFSQGRGYRLFNTATGVVSGDYGPVGGIALPDRFTIHNTKSSKDGAWLAIARTNILSGTDNAPFFWEIDTVNVIANSKIAPSGHWTCGYEEFLNNDSNNLAGIPYWAHARRPFAAMNSPHRIANPSPTPFVMVGLDDHLSFNGPQNSLMAVMSASVNKTAPFPAAWYDEILGFDLSGNGKVYRFCHTFTSNTSGNFYADNAIGVVDQLNKFVCWTSDWMKTLAKQRIDVFVVALR